MTISLFVNIKKIKIFIMTSSDILQNKDYFIHENIGIFDDTPDVSRTVAVVDGYIGEESTSIVNLFGAAGKPLFILNNYIFDKIQK